MRILHLSHGGLPDWRIEKSALGAASRGYKVFFAGKKSDSYKGKSFSKVYEVNWTSKAKAGIPLYWHSVKKQVEKVLREVRPDIVHAHNIFSAKMMLSEFGLPFIYDDHEYWSVLIRLQAESLSNNTAKPATAQSAASGGGLLRKVAEKKISNFLIYRTLHLVSKWERELASSVPVVTVSDKIARELRAIANSNRVFVVPNFPLSSEVKDFQKPRIHTALSSVYAGLDSQYEGKPAHRNIDGLTDVFESHDIGDLVVIGWSSEASSSGKVKYKGFLPRQEMYNEMSKHSIGLIPWKKHWTHAYSSPNKAYEYAHVGLFVMCTSTFETVTENLKENCITFEDYEQLASQLEYFKENLEELYRKRLKIFEFARNELIWDKFENNIFQAYQLCC